ncbi:MAG: hypothetical protein R3268_13010, partial [Acidiferrobacterales bacterium]|nr:hypothetical protein [Acidiferrobacterales bacterium]
MDLHRLKWIKDGGQFLIVHMNEVHRFFRRVESFRRNSSHAIANKSHDIPTEDRHVADLLPNITIPSGFTGYNRLDPRDIARSGNIYAENSRVRIRTAKNLAPQNSRETDIRRKKRAPTDLFTAIRTGNGRANHGEFFSVTAHRRCQLT